ncbi:MAG TPA: ester cyclase [Chloroflexota bacterium]
MQGIRFWNASFGDTRFGIEEPVAEGNKVATRVTMRSVHSRGEFQGLAPTGKQIAITGITIETIEGGVIVERRVETDWLAMLPATRDVGCSSRHFRPGDRQHGRSTVNDSRRLGPLVAELAEPPAPVRLARADYARNTPSTSVARGLICERAATGHWIGSHPRASCRCDRTPLWPNFIARKERVGLPGQGAGARTVISPRAFALASRAPPGA